MNFRLHNDEQRAEGQYETNEGSQRHRGAITIGTQHVHQSNHESGYSNGQDGNDGAGEAIPENLEALEDDCAEHDSYESKQQNRERIELSSSSS